jgi:hypothetical protein
MLKGRRKEFQGPHAPRGPRVGRRCSKLLTLGYLFGVLTIEKKVQKPNQKESLLGLLTTLFPTVML